MAIDFLDECMANFIGDAADTATLVRDAAQQSPETPNEADSSPRPPTWDGTVPDPPSAWPGHVVEWAYRNGKFGWIQRRPDIADVRYQHARKTYLRGR